jgi:hypothetical protein
VRPPPPLLALPTPAERIAAQAAQKQKQTKIKADEARAPCTRGGALSAAECHCAACVVARIERRRLLLLPKKDASDGEEEDRTVDGDTAGAGFGPVATAPPLPIKQKKKRARATPTAEEDAFLRRALRLRRRYQTADDAARRAAVVRAFADDRDASSSSSSEDSPSDA